MIRPTKLDSRFRLTPPLPWAQNQVSVVKTVHNGFWPLWGKGRGRGRGRGRSGDSARGGDEEIEFETGAEEEIEEEDTAEDLSEESE